MKKQQGLTLIELMIALTLGLFIIASTLTLFVTTAKSSSDTIKAVRLNHDLDTVMSLMLADIRRAGYSGLANVNNPDAFSNPFVSATSSPPTNLQIGNSGVSGSTNDCVLYTYDADYDGTVDDNEYYGFRLYYNSSTKTKTVQMRVSNNGATTNTCSTGTWYSVTDENTLDVTALQFRFSSFDPANNSSPCSNTASTTCLTATSRCYNYKNGDASSTVSNAGLCTNFTKADGSAGVNPPATDSKIGQKPVVNIRLTAQLVNDSAVVKALSGSVKVANDRLYKQP